MEKPGTKHVCIIGVMVIGVVAGVIAVIASVAFLRNCQQQVLPEVQTMPMPSELHIKAVEHVSMAGVEASGVSPSYAVSMVCGASAAADSYDVRNDALRSIARRRDLPNRADLVATVECHSRRCFWYNVRHEER